MGKKLLLDSNDSFYELAEVKAIGIAGSCYCCTQQIHIHNEDMDYLPLVRVNKENFYIFICDQCEDDVEILNEAGISEISYDVLWAIQESLEEELNFLEDRNGGITSVDRDYILINLYRESYVKFKSVNRNKYIEKMPKEEFHEDGLQRSSKKNN